MNTKRNLFPGYLKFASLAIIFCQTGAVVAQQTFCTQNDASIWIDAVVQTSDGGYALGGSCVAGCGNFDFHITKTDADGNYLWGKGLGGGNKDNMGDLIETSDGGFLMVGHTASYGTLNTLYTLYVIKTDGNANIEWTRIVEGTEYEMADGVVETSDGGFAVVGGTTSYGAGGCDVYLVKLDANGTVLWTKTYGTASSEGEYGSDIIETSDGGLAIVSDCYNTATSVDLYVLKLEADGDLQWSTSVSQDYSGIETAFNIVQTSDGGYVLGGRTSVTTGNGTDFYLAKISSTGAFLWGTNFGSTGMDANGGMVQTTDGGFVISGRCDPAVGYYDGLIVKFDSGGNFLWSKRFGDPSNTDQTDEPKTIIQTTDGGFAIGGGTRNMADFSAMHAYFVKLNQNGYGCCIIENNWGTAGSGGISTSMTSTTLVGTGGVSGSGGTTISMGSLFANCFSDVGVEDNSTSEMSTVFPNPNNGLFELEVTETVQLKIVSTVGEVLYDEAHHQNDGPVNVTDFPAGTYFVSLTNVDGMVDFQRMVIQH